VPLIPPARPGGRPRKTYMRAAMNAIRICCICCGPAARGAICRATAFRLAQAASQGVGRELYRFALMGVCKRNGEETFADAWASDEDAPKAAIFLTARLGRLRTATLVIPRRAGDSRDAGDGSLRLN
jgi:hypothetical protein